MPVLSQWHLLLPCLVGFILASVAGVAVDPDPLGHPLLPARKVAPNPAQAGCCSAATSPLIEEVVSVASTTTNMFTGTRVPRPNVELFGKLACCVLFKM